MSGRSIKIDSTDVSTVIRILDSGDGTPETGVEHNTSGIDLWYRREGAAKVSITEAALASLDAAHSDGGIEHIGDGYYRLDLPDAACASGANSVMVGGTVTGMIVIGIEHPLVAYNPQDATRLGLLALPNAAADAAGGLPISDVGGLDMDAIKSVLDTAAADVVNIDGAAMRGTDGAYTGTPPTAAAIADQVWDEATSGHTNAGTFGAQVKTSIDTILARLGAWTGTGVNTVLGAFKALLSKDASTPSDIGGTFDPEADSTEAIRDRGDAAWTSGSSSISVQPLSSTVGERVNETTITAYYGENGWTIGPVVVTDADGDAVNLAAYTSLKLVIEDDHGTDILILEGNDITISGASNNQWTATGTSAVTTSTVSVDYRWAIRGISTGVDVVLGRGKVQVIYAPNED